MYLLVFFTLAQVPFSWAVDIATINQKTFTDEDIRSSLSGLNVPQRERYLADRNNKRQVLNQLIDQEILTQEAKKVKLDVDTEFHSAMESFKRNFLANRLLETNLRPKLTQEALKKYYEANKRRYGTGLVHVQHILATDEGTAKSLLSKAKAPDADFQNLAEKFSQDPSAKNNRGDLGLIRQNQFTREFTDAAFGGNKGEIVGPIKTQFGYHIIKIVKRVSGQALSFDDVELRVRNDLREVLAKQFISQLRVQAEIQVNDKALDKM